MPDITIQRITGNVLTLGDGAVGKTTLALNLTSDFADETKIGKTKNLEFEFYCDEFSNFGTIYRVNHQYFTPPGQKEAEGDRSGRSFEKVIEIYRDIIGTPQVVLLVYDLSNLESFHNLEFWINQSVRLADANTAFILVGTHIDSGDKLVVDEDLIGNGIRFIELAIRERLADWNQVCQHIEVSGRTQVNIQALRQLISREIMRTRGLVCVEGQLQHISTTLNMSVR